MITSSTSKNTYIFNYGIYFNLLIKGARGGVLWVLTMGETSGDVGGILFMLLIDNIESIKQDIIDPIIELILYIFNIHGKNS
jgi:hypothetical protein